MGLLARAPMPHVYIYIWESRLFQRRKGIALGYSDQGLVSDAASATRHVPVWDSFVCSQCGSCTNWSFLLPLGCESLDSPGRL